MATLKGFARFIYETDIDNLPDQIKTGTISFSSSMTGDDYQNGVSQEIGTTEENLDVPGDVGSNPMVLIVNLDNDNFIEVGAGGVFNQRVNPKEFAVFRANGTTPTAKADTAACNVQIFAWEE